MRTMFDNRKPVCIALKREKEDTMKKIMVLAIMIMILALAGSAMAADITIDVRANVVGTCRITTPGPLSVDFGDLAYDATGSSIAATQTTTIDYWCTNNAAYTISDAGLNDGVCPASAAASCMKFGASEIPYSRTVTTSDTDSLGGGPLAAETVTVQIDIAPGAADNADLGLHQDTVTVTVAP